MNSTALPAFVAWIRFCTPIYYAFQALAIVQWKNGPIEGQQALDFLVSTPTEYWNNIYCLCLLVAAWRIGAYLMLRWNIEKFQ